MVRMGLASFFHPFVLAAVSLYGCHCLGKKMLILNIFFDYFGYYALIFFLNFDYFDTMH